jgi:hypothetical protein
MHLRSVGEVQGTDDLLLGILLLFLLGANAAAQLAECDQEKSRQEVQRLSTAGVIISTAQFLPYVTVVVDQRWWGRSSLEEKSAVSQHVDCAVAGPNSRMLRTVIFRSRDNQELGVYSQDELKLPPARP